MSKQSYPLETNANVLIMYTFKVILYMLSKRCSLGSAPMIVQEQEFDLCTAIKSSSIFMMPSVFAVIVDPQDCQFSKEYID